MISFSDELNRSSDRDQDVVKHHGGAGIRGKADRKDVIETGIDERQPLGRGCGISAKIKAVGDGQLGKIVAVAGIDLKSLASIPKSLIVPLSLILRTTFVQLISSNASVIRLMMHWSLSITCSYWTNGEAIHRLMNKSGRSRNLPPNAGRLSS